MLKSRANKKERRAARHLTVWGRCADKAAILEYCHFIISKVAGVVNENDGDTPRMAAL